MNKRTKIVSWNVNGIRACVRKEAFNEYLASENPDILCIQETKAHHKELDDQFFNPLGYHSSWFSAQKKGYSGVATFTKEKPIAVHDGFGIEKYDSEGRVLISEYEHFFVLNVYFPNGQRDDIRLQYKLDFYNDFFNFCEELKKEGKPLIICGDYNTAHKEIDLARPKENANTSGFMKIEREWLDKIINDYDYVDTFRCFNNEPKEYSWWSYRARARANNVGWRIDYVFISKILEKNLQSSFIQQNIMGSDHCPVGIVLEI